MVLSYFKTKKNMLKVFTADFLQIENKSKTKRSLKKFNPLVNNISYNT